MAPSVQSSKVLKLKVTLKDTKPPIWRRLLVQDNMSLSDLHEAIQVVMEWMGYHMYHFEIAGDHFGNPKMTEEVSNDTRVKLSQLVKDGISRFTYTYDFGDDWVHGIVIEGEEMKKDDVLYPICIAGKRCGPPEDCGGPWGYQELIEILATPDHPEREERLEWLEEKEFTPELFDMAAVNSALRVHFTKTGKSRRNSAG